MIGKAHPVGEIKMELKSGGSWPVDTPLVEGTMRKLI